MNPATGPHGTPRKRPVVTAETTETTEDRLRRELSQSSQAEARESLLREECARLRADNRALKRAEARRLAPPSAALYGPATRKALEGPLLTGGELVVASKERPPGAYETSYELGIAIWLRNNGIDGIEPAAMRRACFHVSTLEQLVNLSRQHMNLVQQRFDALPDPAVRRTLLAALTEARQAIDAGRVPAGAEPFVKWWPGASQYEGGRGVAPVGLWASRLPDDALRCVCEHLAPTQPTQEDFAAQDLLEESEEYCNDYFPDSADGLGQLGEGELDELTSDLGNYQDSLRIYTRAAESRLECAKDLKLVCSRWRHALKNSVARLACQVFEYQDHRDMLEEKSERARDMRLALYGDPNEHPR